MSKHVSVSYVEPLRTQRAAVLAFADIWREMGVTVSLGPDYDAGADLCMLHHNLTRLDPATLPRPPDGVRVINGQALDISKRLYSRLRLEPDDDWRGSVIVKTNRNYFGLPEIHASGRIAEHRRKTLSIVETWKEVGLLPLKQYPLLRTMAEVPDWVWRDPELLVERFAPEREGDLFCLRGWIFLGSKGYAYRVYSKIPMVKTVNMERYEILDGVPAELAEYRRRLKLDYGKFDYVQHGSRVYLIDANKTPSYSGDSRSERIRKVAEGILDFL